MNKFKIIVTFILLVSLLIGFISSALFIPFTPLLFAIYFIGSFIYGVVSSISEIVRLKKINVNILLKICIVILSLLFYKIHILKEYNVLLTIIICSSYLIVLLFYLLKKNFSDLKLNLFASAFIALSLLFIGFKTSGFVRDIIPFVWYDKIERLGFVEEPFTIEFKNPEALEMWNRGRIIHEKLKYNSAIDIFNKALQLEPDNALILYSLAQCYASQGELESAIRLLDQAIISNDDIINFYFNRGLYYYKLSNNKEAIKDYKRALSIDSTNCYVYYNLSLAYYFSNNYNAACQTLEKAEHLGFRSSTFLEKEIKSKCE